MIERPILFSGPMVRAILDGRKTQTRRVVKLPHANPLGEWQPTAIGGENGGRTASGETVPLQGAIWHTRTGDCLMSPHGQPGDRLWVRETTYDVERNGFVGPVFVESDEGAHAAAWGWGESDDPDYIEPYELRKRPAIHMPRSMARITLEIVGVRVERLRNISAADARAEGIEFRDDHIAGRLCRRWRSYGSVDGWFPEGRDIAPIHSFQTLWDSLNATRGHGWEANPWVWVVEFRRTES
ncbi:hypothetical protein WJ63_08200 [Burkholderia pyrrocinia]|nr:hypothetical protein WJ63_08200 [Burkholderia pyrrocinia]